MLSYIESVSQLIDKPILQRGQKLFLDGKVFLNNDLVLDYWREYKVQESNDRSFIIKIPLLHLALSRSKWDQANTALQETVSCTCEYFETYGVCRHIAGVCSSLDQEFRLGNYSANLQKQASEIFDSNLPINSSLMDQINRTNLQKQQNEWINDFEKAILDPNWNGKSKFLSQLSTEIVLDSADQFLDFWNNIDRLTRSYFKDYDKEKQILNLAADCLIYNPKIWWNFWKDFVFKSDIRNSRHFWFKFLYLKEDANVAKEYSRITSLAKDYYTYEQRLGLLNFVADQTKNNFKIILEFAIDFDCTAWIIDNLNNIDPQTLFKLINTLPEYESEIESIVAAQIKEWMMFIQTDDAQELIEVIDIWYRKIGKSETFMEVIEYAKKLFSRKRKIIAQLAKY